MQNTIVYNIQQLERHMQQFLPNELAQYLSANRITALVDGLHAGKTTILIKVIEQLRKAKVKVGGIIQPVIFASGERVGYSLQNVLTGEVRTFAKRLPVNHENSKSCYEFNNELWGWAHNCLQEACSLCEFVIVDELGRLESQGNGHMPALLAGLSSFSSGSCHWLLCIREDQFDSISKQYAEYIN